MSVNNSISAVLTDVDRDAAKAAILVAKSKMPFLISLPENEKKRKRKMGSKSVEYVKLCLRGAQNFPQYLLPAFDSVEFGKDVNLISQLWEVRIVVESLLEMVDDTMSAAAMDSMKTADEAYDYLKKAAAKDAAVKTIVEEIGKRFEGQGVKKTSKGGKGDSK